MQNNTSLSPLQTDIIKTLLYFNIFQYPLTADELLSNSIIDNIQLSVFTEALDFLSDNGKIKKEGGFYFLGNPDQIRRRIAGNNLAKKRMKTALRFSSIISKFPFVKSVMLSGSISKGYMEKDSDIDYFIVTAPGRLWIARTALILFKKIMLLNSRKDFCLNYFIDNDHLEVPDKNIFTARELSSLVPVSDQGVYENLIKRNNWLKEYLPSFVSKAILLGQFKSGFLKRSFEFALSTKLGDWLDSFCMKLTVAYWKRKHKNTPDVWIVNIRCKKHVAKYHPNGYQFKVVDMYQRNLNEYFEQNKIEII